MKGTRLGRYEIQEEIGRGGVAVVYRAKDERLGTSVAVKVLSPSLASGDEALARFEREARAGAAVEHPAIARLLDAGLEGATHYLVFEMLTGGTLAERLRSGGALPWREAVRLAAQVARALAALHAAGVIHRDVKPSNVLVDAEGNAKLADFGLARDPSSEDGLTKTGELVGTPEYASPEQHDGKGVDERCDLYGLGALLFALLTGGPPFRGGGFGLLKKVLQEPAPDVRTVARDVPPELAALVARLLAKRPADRGETAARVARELDGLLVEPPSRTPVIAALLAGALLALVLMGAALLTVIARDEARSPKPSPAPPPAPVARAPFSAPAAPVLSVTACWGRRALCARAAILGVAFVGTDTALAAGDDGSLVLWDLARRERRGTLVERGPAIVSLAARGSYAVAADATGAVRLFESRSGHELRSWGATNHITRVDMAADDVAVFGDDKGQIHIEDLKGTTDRFFAAPATQFSAVVALAVSSDRALFVASDVQGRLLVSEPFIQGAPMTVRPVNTPVLAIAVASDGRTLALGLGDGSIHRLDRKGTLLSGWRAHGAAVRALRFTPDGRRIVSASVDPQKRVAAVWDAGTGQLLGELKGHAGAEFSSLDVSPDGSLALTANADGSLGIFSLETFQEVAMDSWLHRSAVAAIALSESGDYGVSVGFDRILRGWKTDTGRVGATIEGAGGPYQGAQFVDETNVLCVTAGGSMPVFDIRTGAGSVLKDLRLPPGSARFSLAADEAAYEAHGNELTAYDMAKRVAILQAILPRRVSSMASARPLVIGTDLGAVLFWSTDRHEVVADRPAHVGDVLACAASADHALALTGGAEGDVVLWDAASATEKARFSCHERVSALAFAPGTGALVGTADGLLRLVDLPSGRELGRLDLGPGDAPSALAVSPRTGAIFVGTERGLVEKLALNR